MKTRIDRILNTEDRPAGDKRSWRADEQPPAYRIRAEESAQFRGDNLADQGAPRWRRRNANQWPVQMI